MKIHKVEGGFTVADEGGWLPGLYATEQAAERALTFDISALEKLAERQRLIYPHNLDRLNDPHDSLYGIDTDKDPLVPGQRYRVSWSDCCAEGWFEGAFIKDDSAVSGNLVFDCGEVSTVIDGETWITAAD